jgi:glycosyltransferase involved in cell wall biosynthesis
MNLAIVVDDLIQFGGQEKLFEEVCAIWPHAPVYTTQISDAWRNKLAPKETKVVTSYMQKLPFAQKLNRHYFPSLTHILAFESFDFSEYDIVLSISSRFAHFVNTKPSTVHVAYMNSPGRMFWETADYFANEDFTLKKHAMHLLSPFLSYIRQADYIAAQKPDIMLGNSEFISQKINKYYRRQASVIYPFIDPNSVPLLTANEVEDYFVVISRLAAWKRVDIAVQACTELGLRLKIIGTGPALENLQSIAGPTVEFTGRVSEEIKWEIIQRSQALIQTQQEDFGIVALEAQLCGKPVIAFGKGGALETVVQGKTGEFFHDQSAESLKTTLQNFDPKSYSPSVCRAQALKFGVANFKSQLRSVVEGAVMYN